MNIEFNGQRRNHSKRRVKVNYDQAKLYHDPSQEGVSQFRRRDHRKKSVYKGILGNLGKPSILDYDSPPVHFHKYNKSSSTGYIYKNLASRSIPIKYEN